ncbi:MULTISPECIES: hypothetical protein [unclassified Micromonospora]|uniref:hypothetical protein n=1 Tax=unclassified Micromonospora TaxID=2617518 RepID=UPI0010523278|nr:MULTISPECIES: hypothetical protein [unclassified Micromonospora]TDB79412.1 hypothetical protein E1182_12745 [Micromonospora sp. KC721]TDC42160.1 hypothetical protein E1166_08755 [Micromonospora sp. KC213]
MTITTSLEHPARTTPRVVRPAGARPVERPGTGLAPPAPPPSLRSRCRGRLLRIQQFLLGTVDECPPILLHLTQRN